MDILLDVPAHVWISEGIRLAIAIASLELLGTVARWGDRRLIRALVIRALARRGLL